MKNYIRQKYLFLTPDFDQEQIVVVKTSLDMVQQWGVERNLFDCGAPLIRRIMETARRGRSFSICLRGLTNVIRTCGTSGGVAVRRVLTECVWRLESVGSILFIPFLLNLKSFSRSQILEQPPSAGLGDWGRYSFFLRTRILCERSIWKDKI